MQVPSVSEPTVTRNADGTATLNLPEHPLPFYPVSTELLQEWVDVINENVRLKALLTRAGAGRPTSCQDYTTSRRRGA